MPELLAPPKKLKDEQGVQADPRKEYVSGGWFQYAKLNRALPFYIDDITQDFGDDLYDRMLKDPQVDSSIEILKLATISQGLHMVPAVRDEDPDAELAMEISRFCSRQLDRLEQPFLAHTLYDMMDALAFGNRVAEMIYEIPERGIDQGKLCLKRIKVKPRRSVAFVVDPYLNVVGILGQVPGQMAPTLMTAIASPASSIINLYPRRKFAILTYRPQNNDPRGTSALRPAYNSWWIKQQVWPEYLKYISQFASPSLVGTLAEQAQRAPKIGTDGQIARDAAGAVIYVEPQQAMLEALQGFRNGTAMVIPFGSKVDAINVNQMAGSPFIEIIGLLDRQITKAILCQTLATEEGRFQARAAAQTHQDVLELVIYHAKVSAVTMIQNDILRPIVEYNWGEEVADRLTPIASLSETERHDFAANATAIAKLMHVGFLHPSQFSEIDALLNLPPRSDPEGYLAEIMGKLGGDPSSLDRDSGEKPPSPGKDKGAEDSEPTLDEGDQENEKSGT